MNENTALKIAQTESGHTPIQSFYKTLQVNNLTLDRQKLEILQINVGKLCNLACLHCHVEAGPKRTEIMTSQTVDRILHLLRNTPAIKTLDLTGGAPEMVPDFRRLVTEARALNVNVIDRCNLTILYEEGYEDLAEFLAENQVKIVASLPCYQRENVDKQRGRGTFDASIDGLILLNKLGYAKQGTGLELDLVYNPVGAHLPPDQAKLEADYKKQLKEDFDIVFNKLYTITNIPIKRFARQLKNWGKHNEYMQLLLNSFNPHAAEGVMCRNTVSISWDGFLFDCDFNQMEEIPIAGKKTSVWDINSFDEFNSGRIAFANHCYGCTAGAGSSCQGSLV